MQDVNCPLSWFNTLTRNWVARALVLGGTGIEQILHNNTRRGYTD